MPEKPTEPVEPMGVEPMEVEEEPQQVQLPIEVSPPEVTSVYR